MRVIRIVPVASTSLVQPGGMRTVDSGSSITAGPSSPVPAGRNPSQHLELDAFALDGGLARGTLQVLFVVAGAGELDVDPGRGRGHPDRHELERLLVVSVAVPLLVFGCERVA